VPASSANFWNTFKRILLFVCLLIPIFGLRLLIMDSMTDQVYPLNGSYRAYADSGIVALQSMYNVTSGGWLDTLWWQQAVALGTVIDYSSRASTIYTDDIATTFNADKFTGFLNGYYDDEGWWAITWIKAYDLTGNREYLNTAKSIFKDMAGGWDSRCGGGLWWDKARTYKNAIPNELFLTIAARLHQRTPGDVAGGGRYHASYIDWANREWQWFKSSGLTNSSDLVNDGLAIDGKSCQNNGENTWTYNQGVILGGLADMYKISGDVSYLSRAEAIADANMLTNVDGNGILYEKGCEPTGDCDDDGAIFKGIFMENLYYLYTVDGKTTYRDFILKNASAICVYNRDSSNNFGLHWDGPFDRSQANRQSSAMETLNAAIVLTVPKGRIA